MKPPTATKLVFEAVALFATGLVFSVFGCMVCSQGAWSFGIPFALIGLVAITWSIVHALRGSRLGIRIENSFIVVSMHIGKQIIPLSSVKSFYRGLDTTVLVFQADQQALDDSFFQDPTARDFFLAELKTRVPFSTLPSSETSS